MNHSAAAEGSVFHAFAFCDVSGVSGSVTPGERIHRAILWTFLRITFAVCTGHKARSAFFRGLSFLSGTRYSLTVAVAADIANSALRFPQRRPYRRTHMLVTTS